MDCSVSSRRIFFRNAPLRTQTWGTQPPVRFDKLACCALQGRQRFLNTRRFSLLYVLPAKLMELRQETVCRGQHLDSARIFGNSLAGQRPKGNIVGQRVQIGAGAATSQAESGPLAVRGLRY